MLNEVKSNPNPDFVELLNTSDAPVDITGWRAIDDDRRHTPRRVHDRGDGPRAR